MMLHLLTFVLVAATAFNSVKCFTEEEKQLMKNLHDKCVAETSVSEAVLDAARKGNFDGSEPLMCFIKCMWVTMTVMDDDGNIDEEILKVLIPPEMKDSMLAAYEKCKNEGGSTPCEKAYKIGVCLNRTDPKSFFLP